MGMYTGLRCKVIIKPEYKEEFELMHSINYEWDESNLDFLREYGQYSRATFIPRGSLSYMPDSWEVVPLDANGRRQCMYGTPTDGFDRTFDKDTGLWSFQCSLKNYDSTIEYFFDNVLCKVTEQVIHLEYYYEEAYRSTFYDLVDGRIVVSDRVGVLYKKEYPDISLNFRFESKWS
ncbi:hypothetical protein M5X17_27795 [Paenibacillus alvei]|uniref:hypothetical protein n=1 Tax=Paenibacillus alvei TaxID=44250 RepID=UPI0022800A9A|nr:hypothetical protein [Paenibacillus alvei]MCY9737510.1 hypothetical protein [Paenibacillus alvei]